MTVLTIPLFAFFTVLTVLVLAAGLRRLMGITLSPHASPSASGLYGVLAEIDALGLNLLELRKLTPDGESPGSGHHRSP